MKTRYWAMTLASLFILNTAAFADHPLSGTYTVKDTPDCNNAFYFVSSIPVTIVATDKDIEVSTSGAYPTYGYKVGKDVNVFCQGTGFCYDTIQFDFDGSYSDNGTHFKAIETLRDLSSPRPQPVYTGEVNFTISNSVLELTSTAINQFQPGPKTTCLLTRIK